jgi:hypothetical protein
MGFRILAHYETGADKRNIPSKVYGAYAQPRTKKLVVSADRIEELSAAGFNQKEIFNQIARETGFQPNSVADQFYKKVSLREAFERGRKKALKTERIG